MKYRFLRTLIKLHYIIGVIFPIVTYGLNGTWDGSDTAGDGVNWTDNDNWQGIAHPNNTSERATFLGSAYSGSATTTNVTVGSDITIGQIYNGAGNNTDVHTGDINISGAGIITLDSVTTNQILWYAGSGALTISNNIVNKSAFANQMTISVGGTSGDVTFDGNISEDTTSQGLQKLSGGTVYLNGNNTFTGDSNLDLGTVYLGSDTALGSSGNINVAVGDLNIALTSGVTRTISNGLNFTSTNSLKFRGQGGSKLSFSSNNISLTGSGTITLSSQDAGANNVEFTGSGFSTSSNIDVRDGRENLFLSPTSGTQTWNGIISSSAGNGVVTHNGAGTVVLNGNNTFAGGVFIGGGGNLRLGHANAMGTGNMVITNGTIEIGNAITWSPPTLNLSAGTANLMGEGTYNAALNLDDNTAGRWNSINPGLGDSDTGTLTVNTASTIYGGSTYVWEISNADLDGSYNPSGSVGSDWDYLNFTSSLDMTNVTTGNKMNINISSVGSTGWDFGVPNGSGTGFKILEASSISWNGGAFNEDFFNLDTSNFTDGDSWWMNWSIYESGNALYLRYDAVPEPGTYVMISLIPILIFLRKKFLA